MTPDNEIHVRRWFPHPPERVWAAWTHPDRLSRWWGPEGFATETARFELVSGGEWVHDMVHPVQGRFPNHVRFEIVEPPHRLVYAHVGDVGFRSEATFEATGGGTLLSIRSVFPTAAALQDVVTRFGALEGSRQMLSRLEREVGRTPRVRVAAFSVSLDGFGAGPDQSLEAPLGVGGGAVHGWLHPTRFFHQMIGKPGGEIGVDDDFAVRGFEHVGAWILGRNMFGPIRGPWPDRAWRGWWGEEPPYHCDVFVLTHHAREPLVMTGTTFHFVTDGIEAALARAKAFAGDKDVRIGGGAATIRQYLTAGLLDELHLAVAPVVLGRGEPLLAGLDLQALGYDVVERAAAGALHVVLRRR